MSGSHLGRNFVKRSAHDFYSRHQSNLFNLQMISMIHNDNNGLVSECSGDGSFDNLDVLLMVFLPDVDNPASYPDFILF